MIDVNLIAQWCNFLTGKRFHLCNAINTDDLTLQLVQVVFRHGARTPSRAEALRVNVTNSAIYWPEGHIQLTNVGKQQAYKLGTLLRKKYDKFLGPYNPQEYYALTTGYTRTIMSLQLALAGLFPPAIQDSWSNKLHWRPIPFHRNPIDLDITLAPHQTKLCKDLYLETINNSIDFQRNLSKYTEFLENMENQTGFPFKTDFLYNSAWTLYAIEYHKAMGLPLPAIYTQNDSLYATMREVCKLSVDGMSMTPQLNRLNGGTLVRQFIENINKNRNAARPKKIYLYCSHDGTLHAFSKAQDFEAFYLPPVGSALIMEKYADSQKSEYLRMLSWDPADGEHVETVRIGNCDELCPFKDYLEIVKDNIATDEDLEYLNNEANKGSLLNE
ncbi:testicular acid phosphatase homolog [Nasonia vitripennis]|uniref:acid phosphatase n=1 Tax=Nasonia vitripennis TaxID=7425 RepID=A0A7M7TAV5_NASVI|nr:testicular acid phosphatase homolog [Nasonia vitripennis]